MDKEHRRVIDETRQMIARSRQVIELTIHEIEHSKQAKAQALRAQDATRKILRDKPPT